MIELCGVSRSFGGKQALNDINLTIKEGLTFLVGPSGAGKSTLAAIIAGTDRGFTGTIRVNGSDITTRSEAEAFHALNTNVGLIWQSFNLISSRTVAENVALPLEIADVDSRHPVARALRAVGMDDFSNRRVRELSGGQRQRVAIARELAKDPAVIIADEPTSALDPKSTRACMDALRNAARGRCVLVITHDESLIAPTDGIIRIVSGSITEVRNPKHGGSLPKRSIRPEFRGLSAKGAARLALNALKNGALRSSGILVCALMLAALIAPIVHGAVSNQTNNAFSQVFESYGENALDISVMSSFIGAGGTDGADTGPDVDVDQDTTGLFERYAKDPRVKSIYAIQPYDDINIELDSKSATPKASGYTPVFDHLVAGKMPDPSANEVVIPQATARELGLDPEKAIGKHIVFEATVTTWKDKEPIRKPIETHVRISGVADTTQHTSYEGQIYEFEVEDAFFFSAKATTEMREQAGLTNEPDFTIRPTSPEAMIEIKDELSAQGIVPLGNFELVENTVRLQDKTQSQSATASATVVAAANALGLAVFAGLAWNRRRETAIMRICGCSKSDTFASISIEGAVIVVASMLLAGICGLVAAGEPALWIIIAASSGITAYLLQIAVATLSNPFTVLKRARR